MKRIRINFLLSSLLALMFILSFDLPCNADKGIFNPKIYPYEIFTTDMPATITVSSEIGDLPMNDVKVDIYKTTEEGKVLESLCAMSLDVPHGVFSGQFTLNQVYESNFYFKIIADYNSQEVFESSILKIAIFEPLPDGISDALQKDLKKLENNFKKYLKAHDLSTSRQMVLRDAKNNPKITSAYLEGRSLSIEYRNKVRGILYLDDPNDEPVDSLK